MKLIEIVAVYPPYRGGIGTVAYQNALMAHQSGMEVTVATPLYSSLEKKAPLSELSNEVQVLRLKPLFSYGNAAIMKGLLPLIKQADVIHLHYPCIGSEWIALIAGSVMRKKILLTYHMDLVGKGFFRTIFAIYSFIFLPLVLRAARHVCVTSWDYAEHSRIKKYLSKNKKSFSELSCAVDTVRFFPREKDGDILSRFCLAASSRVILFVGGLDQAHYFKGVSLLIEAFCVLAPAQCDINLLIVGDGDCRAEYERQCKDRGIDRYVHFMGAVTDDELPRYYACADVCVLPSIDSSEAFGIALIEAMACGKPVIASDLPGVRSVVRHGIDGLLIAPSNVIALRDALHTLLSDEVLRNAMGAAAHERVSMRYSSDVVGRQFMSVIQGL